MNLLEIEQFAVETIEEHAAKYPKIAGYRFEWNNRKSAFGVCSKRKRTIYLSRPMTAASHDQSTVIDTILHEIAHALAWEYDQDWSHGRLWKKWAIEIGADPTRCKDGNKVMDIEKMNYKYSLICSTHGKQGGINRASRSTKAGFRWYICPECEGKMELKQNY